MDGVHGSPVGRARGPSDQPRSAQTERPWNGSWEAGGELRRVRAKSCR